MVVVYVSLTPISQAAVGGSECLEILFNPKNELQLAESSGEFFLDSRCLHEHQRAFIGTELDNTKLCALSSLFK